VKLIKVFLAVIALGAVFALTACGGSDNPRAQAQAQANANGSQFKPYIPPPNNTEEQNYNKAQQMYNDPANILWCTVLSQSSTAPIITVPIAGKLTSSTTTAFQPEYAGGHDASVALPANSVDGLYHPNPPPYRYGFTPGGQYVDFFNAPTVCTTQPMEFQRQSVTVKVDGSLNSATTKAEAALKSGDKSKAQAILESAAGQ
jgi:hypothetical protein